LNFIFGIVCLFVCVCAFSLRRESPNMILGDKPLIFEVVLSQSCPIAVVGGGVFLEDVKPPGLDIWWGVDCVGTCVTEFYME
jgi:hypothetical protein